jgi:thymidylate kinase
MFITFEGIEGSGKTTQLRRLAASWRAQGRTVVTTKEPGGTPVADRIRAILLDSAHAIDPVAEMFLFAAPRRQHVMELIRPAIERGDDILCDRFADATLAYQGFGRLLPLDQLRTLNGWATGGLRPDLTLLFDLAEEAGVARARARNAGAATDEGRFEAEDLRFHRRVREGYLSLAAAEPDRFVVVDANGGEQDVYERMTAILQARAGARRP